MDTRAPGIAACFQAEGGWGRICRAASAKGAAWSEGTGQSGAVGKPAQSASLLKPPIPALPMAQFCQFGNKLSTRSPCTPELEQREVG